jgi:hypothetical protein
MPATEQIITPDTTTSAGAPLWAVLLTPRQRWLLERCADWHARVHSDAALRAEFVELTRRLRAAGPVHEAAAGAFGFWDNPADAAWDTVPTARDAGPARPDR